ncbi:hypothetical protein DUZ99_08580 [Xylanibacillus composti]|uniref:Octanoyl-[GcvH]:protein N-octanoyltransferase n=1 Tax=Xylanibacillus composti TaxID=1572762 RepID=A0A8J4M039_9BACL|nr:hypothetical protein [Xylanibacillus composti]MDT9725050.1 hypothetical protein [Xylanibacillus composti]GIQ67470.1 octanoyl-[GcvH]:protein N-octanoyltransferase [Xylanibacillus composti]
MEPSFWLAEGSYRIVERTDPLTGDALIPFAYEELRGRKVGQGELPEVHIWRHQQALILGLRDRKLPAAEQAIRHLRQQGIEVAVRNSGGAAVPLDAGVVNITMLVPKPPGRIDIYEDFDRMYRWIAAAVSSADDVGVGEVQGAYCPGEYDLSIGGLKFCGIAQRRQTRAYAVQAFINAEGSGQERANRVREYYALAAGHSGNEADAPPRVTKDRTASLAELIPGFTAERLVERLKQTLAQWAGPPRQILHVYEEPHDALDAMAASLRDRYDR